MATRKTQTADDIDRVRRALIPVDQAFWNSEQRYGVGRLERLVSPKTLAAYQRGWQRYRAALEEGDPDQLEQIAPLMIRALAVMAAEAEAAGHQPLDVSTWETNLSDGTVLVICRSNAEATAVIRQQKAATMFSAAPEGGLTATTPADDKLPPDLAVTVRGQHDGRRLEVWTLAECARLIEKYGSVVDRAARAWEGTPAPSGRQQDEMAAYDTVRRGYPLREPVNVPATSAVGLPF